MSPDHFGKKQLSNLVSGILICSLLLFLAPHAMADLDISAGRTGTTGWPSTISTAATIQAQDTIPPGSYQLWAEESSDHTYLKIAVPATMTPGTYTLRLTFWNPLTSPPVVYPAVNVDVTVNPIPPIAPGQTPVLLLNGWQYSRNSPCPVSYSSSATFGTLRDDASHNSFGRLQDLLQQDGRYVLFFDNCRYGKPSIESLGNELNRLITLLNAEKVDIVAHSMGGLIVRAYLSGLQEDGSLLPPLNPRVRKFVEIATPNFGSFKATTLLGAQTTEMIPGSNLLWTLATWNQGGDDLRGVDALAIIGNAGSFENLMNASDGIVSLTSAALGFLGSSSAVDSRTRIVPYCHTDPTLLIDLATLGTCTGSGGIANITDASHPSARIIRSFLADTSEWTSIGTTPAQDQYLSKFGGVYFRLKTETGQYVDDLYQVSFGGVALLNGRATKSIFYKEFIQGTASFQASSYSRGLIAASNVQYTFPARTYDEVIIKYPPGIRSIGPLIPMPWGQVIRSGAPITISGYAFGTRCNACQVLAYPGGVSLAISSWTDQSIVATLPNTFNGLVAINVQAASGQDSVNVMVVSPIATVPLVSPGGIVNGASFKSGEAVSAGSIASIFGIDLGSSSQAGSIRVQLNGVNAPLFAFSPSQINFQVPWELSGQSQAVLTVTSGVTGSPAIFPVATYGPGIFTVNQAGQGAVLIAATGELAAGSEIIPSRAARPVGRGEHITIYCTGLGPVTNQPKTGAKASDNPLSTTITTPTVSIGGVAAPPVAFSGLAPGFVGLYQVNVQVPVGSPTGNAVPVVLSIGGVTANTVAIAVQ